MNRSEMRYLQEIQNSRSYLSQARPVPSPLASQGRRDQIVGHYQASTANGGVIVARLLGVTRQPRGSLLAGLRDGGTGAIVVSK